MKNCNSNCNESTSTLVADICINPCDRENHIVKLFVEECSNRPLDPITVASAVFTEDCETVEEVLDRLNTSLSELEESLASVQDLFGDYLNLNDRVSTNTLDIATLRSNINVLQGSVGSLSDRITEIINNINYPDLDDTLDSILNQLSENHELFSALLENIQACDCASGNGSSTSGGSTNVNLNNYYTKGEINSKLNNYYTKSQLDTTLGDHEQYISLNIEAIRDIRSEVLQLLNNNSNSTSSSSVASSVYFREHRIVDSLSETSISRQVPGYYYVTEHVASNDNSTPLGTYCHKYGDLNLNGDIDIEDVDAIINILLRVQDHGIANYPGDGDTNGGGTIDVEDLNNVINYILGLAEPRCYYNDVPPINGLSNNNSRDVGTSRITQSISIAAGFLTDNLGSVFLITLPTSSINRAREAVVTINFDRPIDGIFSGSSTDGLVVSEKTIKAVICPSLGLNSISIAVSDDNSVRLSDVEINNIDIVYIDTNYNNCFYQILSHIPNGDLLGRIQRRTLMDIAQESYPIISTPVASSGIIYANPGLLQRVALQYVYGEPDGNGDRSVKAVSIEPFVLYYRMPLVGDSGFVYFDQSYTIHLINLFNYG